VPTWAIVVAAGRGTRFGDRKQYQPLGGARVLDWAVRAARASCDGVVLVVPPELADEPEPTADAVVAGGDTRSASVRHGLAAVPPDATVIVVHDAARPVPVPDVWERVLAAVAAGADAAVPAVPITDTLRAVRGGPVDRAAFVAVQTPQAFPADALRTAHAGGVEASDDASLVEAAGGRVVIVDGDPANLKITTTVDLALAELLCR
jgi:2-C-methyl-D-erythritol 4-phosphate cytidylyltransferase